MPDFIDYLLIGGLALLCVGLWLLSPGLALSTVGGVLVIIWLVAYLRAAKKRGG